MPTYVFTIMDGSGDVQPERVQYPSLDVAKSQMVTLAGEMLKSIDGAFWQDSDWQIDLADDTGLILCSIMVHGTQSPALTGS